jgi:hypothetical protein
MMAGVLSLNFRSSPNLQIKSHPRIMSRYVGESEPDSERNTKILSQSERKCCNFTFGLEGDAPSSEGTFVFSR